MASTPNESVNYDQDKRGWAMVAAMFTSAFVIMGNLKALGVLLIPITNDLDSELWLVGWIAIWFNAGQDCFGPLVGALCRLVGSRPVMVSGALLLTMGFILTSLSPNVPLMIIFIVAFAGFGSALVWYSCFSVMASYFKEKYQLAVGISMMATPIGLMVYGPMTQLLLDTYGWRATMLLLGGFSFHLVACGLLVRRDPSSSLPDTEQYQEISVNDDEESKEERGDGRYESITETSDDEARAKSDFRNSGVEKCYQGFTAALDFAVLTNVRFILQTAAHFTFSFSYGGYVVFMVSQGQISGLSVHQASFLPFALGIGNIIGRALQPLLQVIGVVPSMTCWAFFGSSLTGASMIANVSISSFFGQFAVTGLTGIGIGVLYQAIDVLLRFLSTDDRLVNLMGWQGVFAGLAGALGGLVSGWIYEWTGSFSISFYVVQYTNTRAKVVTPEGEMEEFEIVAGVRQGDNLAPFLVIIVLDYALRQSTNGLENELGFTIASRKSRRVPAVNLTDLDFADDVC
ncbi:monocarboxylate transporter 13-like [Patiria miniata]|uniref:Major facilitator superfamily (MFS) profile domain-containing protein n=1 Tax=Patiria miniata TaxID=46514 RepID=A0A913ZIM4_PATMI|nr:monocarboxylate transporter 13-like [Patiria miniata]